MPIVKKGKKVKKFPYSKTGIAKAKEYANASGLPMMMDIAEMRSKKMMQDRMKKMGSIKKKKGMPIPLRGGHHHE